MKTVYSVASPLGFFSSSCDLIIYEYGREMATQMMRRKSNVAIATARAMMMNDQNTDMFVDGIRAIMSS